jgi:hypothetical protein
VSGPADLRLGEVRLAADEIRKHAEDDANIIFGASLNESQGEDVLVTLIATGLNGHERTRTMPVEAASADLPAPIAKANRHPKRPGRPARQATLVYDVIPVMEVPGHAERPSPTPEAEDLEVPSFLRRRGQRLAP